MCCKGKKLGSCSGSKCASCPCKKFKKVMHKYKEHRLYAGKHKSSLVKSKGQAEAIAYAMARHMKKNKK